MRKERRDRGEPRAHIELSAVVRTGAQGTRSGTYGSCRRTNRTARLEMGLYDSRSPSKPSYPGVSIHGTEVFVAAWCWISRITVIEWAGASSGPAVSHVGDLQAATEGTGNSLTDEEGVPVLFADRSRRYTGGSWAVRRQVEE
jgi:hypothetical protein